MGGIVVSSNPKFSERLKKIVAQQMLKLKYKVGVGKKEKLAKDLNNYLSPIRERREELKPDYIKEVLDAGSKKVLKKAEETMALVKKAMRIDY